MNLRWLWLDFIDPDLPLTREQKRSVLVQARYLSALQTRAQKHHQYDDRPALPIPRSRRWPIIFLIAIAFAAALRAAWIGGMLWQGVPLALVIGPGVWAALAYRERELSKPHINAALRHHGLDVCRACGYWLRGLDDEVKQCPECGAAREAMPHADTTGPHA